MGVSPKQYAIYNQLMFAKQLLHNSQMSITDIGFACGFKSTRRFNDAFLKVLKLSPSQIRKSGSDSATTNIVSLPIKGTINWQHMLNFYRKRMIEGVEEVGEDYYQRTVVINEATGWFRIRCVKSSKHSTNVLEVEFELSQMNQLRNLIRQIRRMFDLDVDINRVEAHLGNVDASLIQEPGIRIPGVWSPWEAGVRAILGQQVSVKAAIGQLNLLAKQLSPKEQAIYFPTPEQVAQADISFLRMPQSRKDTLHRFAAYMVENNHQHPSQWLDIKGIGPWTVQYALLRGLSEPDHLLTGDLIVKKYIDQHPTVTVSKVSPWGSYATFHCWSHF
jgi:AraC family transcriptional regulator of adaptative response / DNA-3-methyladenine glycosylase II